MHQYTADLGDGVLVEGHAVTLAVMSVESMGLAWKRGQTAMPAATGKAG